MTQRNHLTLKPAHRTPLAKRMLIGGSIGLALITAFLIMAGDGNPEWGKFWRIRPLVVVPIAGAMGAIAHFVLDPLRDLSFWGKLVANALSLVIYIIALWLGTVLGLDGTMWD